MVATIESESELIKSKRNDVTMTVATVACVGALVALIWLAFITSNLNEARAKLDTVQNNTTALQVQVFDMSQKTRSHEGMSNMEGPPQGAAGAMQGMPGGGMQQMQQSPAANMPQQAPPAGKGMGEM